MHLKTTQSAFRDFWPNFQPPVSRLSRNKRSILASWMTLTCIKHTLETRSRGCLRVMVRKRWACWNTWRIPRFHQVCSNSLQGCLILSATLRTYIFNKYWQERNARTWWVTTLGNSSMLTTGMTGMKRMFAWFLMHSTMAISSFKPRQVRSLCQNRQKYFLSMFSRTRMNMSSISKSMKAGWRPTLRGDRSLEVEKLQQGGGQIAIRLLFRSGFQAQECLLP